MPRWDSDAEDRLRDAAIALYLEFGYDNVTVAQIADRAGLTRRTFSRYFADKRDVLFAGSDRLPGLLGAAIGRTEAKLTPFAALLTALSEVGGVVAAQAAPHAAQRQKIVAHSPELQERGRTKFAEVSDAIAEALRRRGLDAHEAALLADVGVAIFRSGLARWAARPDGADLVAQIHEAGAALARAVVAPSQL